MNVLLGCDPEIFITDKADVPHSAHGLVPGTKKEPYKVDRGAIQVDGTALEFNIDPAKTEEEWVQNIAAVMSQLREKTPKKFNFLIEPHVVFTDAYFKSLPEEAKEMGCEPDLNAYTMKENPKPNDQSKMRTASGHIHIGITENQDITNQEHIIRMCTLAKHLDLWLGVRSLEWDSDSKRQQLYGKPGAIRIKPYGLEYRVLSNAWLQDEKLVRFVYKQTLACIEDLKKNGALQKNKITGKTSPYAYVKNALIYRNAAQVKGALGTELNKRTEEAFKLSWK